MADFKAHHTAWQKAKKEGKEIWDMLARFTSDFSSAHKDVKHATIPWPKFDKDLGPSLDNLQTLTKKTGIKDKDLAGHKKDVKKNKDKAEAAVKQYKLDVQKLKTNRDGITVPDSDGSEKGNKYVKDLQTVLTVAEQRLDALADLLVDIDRDVKAVKE